MSTSLPAGGLTSAEAAERLLQYGPNDPTPKKQRSQLVELLLQFANPLVSILLFASVVSVFVGELVNAPSLPRATHVGRRHPRRYFTDV